MMTIFDEPACRICGCTQNFACAGGCWWVEDGLCSECQAIDRLKVEILTTGEVRKQLGEADNKSVMKLVDDGKLQVLKKTPIGTLFLQSAVDRYMEKAMISHYQVRGKVVCR